MSKQEFLEQLRKGLCGLPQKDIEERLSFYSEMIDDRIEEGVTEEDAILEIGSVDEIASAVVVDIPLSKIAKERIKPKRQLKAWEIVLLILGSPIWLSLGIAAVAVVFSLYISLWAVIISLWAVFASLLCCVLSITAFGVSFALCGNIAGVAMLGAGVACMGLSVFMFYGCKGATKGFVLLSKKIAVFIKNCFIKKEVA